MGQMSKGTDGRPASRAAAAGPGPADGFTAAVYSAATHHPGYPEPSDTYRWGDQGTDWPPDKFTAAVVANGEMAISQPAPHSYHGDDNMEAYHIAGPYCADNEAETDVGLFTGATGPAGHVTPAAHPELTAP